MFNQNERAHAAPMVLVLSVLLGTVITQPALGTADTAPSCPECTSNPTSHLTSGHDAESHMHAPRPIGVLQANQASELHAARTWINTLLDTSDFPARWYCGNWTTTHGMMHIVSDFAIAGAYAAIPLALIFFMWRRRDIPFIPLFWLFAAFIFFCGLGHFLEAFIFWHPWYRLSGLIKVCTAIASWITVLAMLPILPKALALPKLASTNEVLKAEIAERQKTEEKLNASYDELQAFARNMMGREERMIELKQEVNALLQAMGRESRYPIQDSE